MAPRRKHIAMAEPIIRSLLDTDLYKFTCGYAYFSLFPRANGEFHFQDRDGIKFPEGFDVLLREQLLMMESLALTREEELFLREELPYLPPTYIDFLRGYRFDSREVEVSLHDGSLGIVARGPLYRVTLWEIPILATVSELYFRLTGQRVDAEYLASAAREKAQIMEDHGLRVSIFGARRRFSWAVEAEVTRILKENCPHSLFGTSNLYFALREHLKPAGTHPHEWVQFHGAVYGYKMANYMSMEDWIRVYDGDLGTVLADTYTTDVFLKNLSKKHAALFTSVRQDSGDPFSFADKVIARYQELRIDPMLKYIVFSDALTIPKAVKIQDYCRGRIGSTFGIGTNLTNDVAPGVRPLNIVMKLYRCQLTSSQPWYNCVKLSDVPGKHIGCPEEIQLALSTLNIVS